MFKFVRKSCVSVVCGSVYVFKLVCERIMFKRDVCSRLCVKEVCVNEVCVEVCLFASMSQSATLATQNEGCHTCHAK